MSVLRPVLRSVLSSVLRPVIGGGDLIQRYFTSLDSAFSEYYNIPPVTLTGDFNLKCGLYLTSSPFVAVFGKSDVSNSFIRIQPATSIRYQDGVVLHNITMSTALPLNMFFTFEVIRSGTILSINALSSSGSVISTGSSTVQVNPFTVNTLFRKSVSDNFLNGVGANVKITDNGNLIRDYKIDEDFSTTSVLIDSSGNGKDGTAVNIDGSGTDLFTKISDGWKGQELSNGTTSFPADTTLTVGVGASAGLVYRTTISGLSGAEDFRFLGASGFEPVGNGVFDLVSAGSSMQFRSVGVSETGVNISIKQLLEVA